MSVTDEFNGLIEKLAGNSHGVPAFADVKEFMASRFKKTAARTEFLHPFLTQDPISWVEAKEKVLKWDSEEKKLANKFHFIQGDIVETTRVEGLGTSQSAITHAIWMVVSPDCDCVRGSLVRMAPVYAVDPNSGTYLEDKDNLQLAVKLQSNRLFPIGRDLFSDGMDGYYADLEEPYFLRRADSDSVTVHFSMKEHGWHLLNAFLKESETRADIEEGIAIRRSRVNTVSPPAMT